MRLWQAQSSIIIKIN